MSQKTILLIKMGKNEDKILLEAEDKIETLKTMITDWHTASCNAKGNKATRLYCQGRAHGLEVCLPTIKKLIADYDRTLTVIEDGNAEIEKLLEEID